MVVIFYGIFIYSLGRGWGVGEVYFVDERGKVEGDLVFFLELYSGCEVFVCFGRLGV